jgi:hypothetical protein
VSFAAITLCVTSQQVFVVVYFVIDSVRKILDTPLVAANFQIIFHSSFLTALSITGNNTRRAFNRFYTKKNSCTKDIALNKESATV